MDIDDKAMDEIIARLEKEVKARPKDDRVRLQLALSFMRRGLADEALSHLEIVMGNDRKNADAHYYAGIINADRGELDEAKKYFRRAISLNRRHSSARYFLGKLLAIEGDVEGAIKETEKACNLAPGNASVRAQLGELYLANNRPEDSVEQWEKVLEFDGSNLQALHNLGAIRTDMGQYDKALEYLTRAKRLGSQNPGLFYNMGLCYSATNQPGEAIQAFQDSCDLETDPTVLARNRISLGEAYAVSGNFDKAIECWNTVLKDNPDDLFANYNMGLALLQRGEMEKARGFWRKAIEIEPSYISAHKNLAASYVMEGRFPEAIKVWQGIKKMLPQAVDVDLALSELHFRNGDLDVAHDQLNNLIEKLESGQQTEQTDVMQSRAELLRGTVLLAAGDGKRGVASWVRSMRLDPNFAMANAEFIAREIGPEIIDKARKDSRGAEAERVITLVGAYVSHEQDRVREQRESEQVEDKKEGGFRWFRRGKK